MCCGDSSDYDQPQPQNLQGFLLPQPQQQRVDHYERKRVQAHATQAAHSYGWAGQRTWNRDSYLEPSLGGALYGLPGSDFRHLPALAEAATRPPQNFAVQRRKPVADDPRQQQQQQRRPNTPYHRCPQQQQHQPGGSGSSGAVPMLPKPSYHGAQRRQPVPQPLLERYRAHPQRPSPPPVVREQPTKVSPMSSAPAIRRDIVINGVDPRVHHAESQAAAFGYADFEPQKLVRRDSNGVSECGSDDDRDDPDAWRRHNVSPDIASSREKISHSLYDHMGLGYGRAGGAF
ncbi:hypothetical protein DL767_004026 [Monosporascus sp. MG133]|nr:hypothetical protein DL767_004026 [Monosporascus sp. MG133]